MRTAEERIALLHRRARTIKRKRIAGQLIGCGSAAVCVFAFLMGALARTGVRLSGTMSGDYTASSMLSENAGAYVLVAVAAFMVGVAVTVALIRWQERRKMSDLPGAGGAPADRRDADAGGDARDPGNKHGAASADPGKTENGASSRLRLMDEIMMTQAVGGKKEPDKEK